jgi:hypothetical protein
MATAAAYEAYVLLNFCLKQKSEKRLDEKELGLLSLMMRLTIC